MTDFAAARDNMIESQVRPNGITDSRIIAAMEQVARENFVPEDRKPIAYMDEDVALTAGEHGSGARYLIEAMAFARLVQLAQVKSADKVLSIGIGTGYGAVVLSSVAGEVVGLESDPALAALARDNLGHLANVTVVEGRLEAGSQSNSPFDVILVEGRIADVPQVLLGQLSDGGRLVAVVGETEMAKAHVYTSSGGSFAVRRAFDASVAALPGFARKAPAFVF